MKRIFIIAVMFQASVYALLERPNTCGTDVGCYSACSGTDCDFVVTWARNGDTNIEFTIGKKFADTSSLQWVAVGFSSDQTMGDDSVAECVMESSTDIQVYSSYNVPEKANVRLADPKMGISNEQGSFENGVLKCSFLRRVSLAGNAEFFNLNSTTYYLLVASGQMAGSGSSASKNPHSFVELPVITPDKVDLQDTKDVTGSAKFVLVKVHGCLMVFAWVFAASIGIVMARFFKPVWPNSTLHGEKVWFAIHRFLMVCTFLFCAAGFIVIFVEIHRFLMVCTFLFCAAGFIVIFVEVKDWAKLEGSSRWQKAHPYLGVIVTALVVLNPLMALCRPHPEDKNRPIFNWAHWFVGTVAHILSVLTLIIGVSLAKASVPFYLVWILVGFAGYQVLVVLLLELTHMLGNDSGEQYQQDGPKKEPSNAGVKKVFLGFHVLIITGFTVALIVLIAIK